MSQVRLLVQYTRKAWKAEGLDVQKNNNSEQYESGVGRAHYELLCNLIQSLPFPPSLPPMSVYTHTRMDTF